MSEDSRASTVQLRVRWGETDAAGIVFYPNFYVWFDVATTELVRRAGKPITEFVRKDGYGFPLIEAGARFRAPVFYDDLLTISSTVAEVRTRALRLAHHVTRDGTDIASGYEVRAFAKLDPEQPGRLTMQAIPVDLKARLRAFMATPVS